MKLDRVTITGADDSISPASLIQITKKYPFVEWAILFSARRQGTPRYPSTPWISELLTLVPYPNSRLSAHLCGRWVRDLVLCGKPTFWEQYAGVQLFQRVQLNFHGQYHKADRDKFLHALRNHDHEYIFQHDGVNDALIEEFAQDPVARIHPLFDRSGGAGILPGSWPRPIGKYCGYAGGLGPDNLADELRRISDVTHGQRIWIDMETKVRSEADTLFDLAKVERCLELAKPFVEAS